MPVLYLHCISSFEDTSYKTEKLHDTASSFVSCCCTLAFIYISTYDFLQVFRTSLNHYQKKYFGHKFYFFNGSTQTPLPS